MKFKCLGTVEGKCPVGTLLERKPGVKPRLRCLLCAPKQRRVKLTKAYKDTHVRVKRMPGQRSKADRESIAKARAIEGKAQGTKAAAQAVDILKNMAT